MGRRQPGSSQGRDAEATPGRGRGAGPGTYLGRSCRLPAAGGRAGSGSRSPPRCCDTRPHSPRCQRHTRSRLRGGDAGEPSTGAGGSSGPHDTGGRGPAETGKPHPSRQASRERDPPSQSSSWGASPPTRSLPAPSTGGPVVSRCDLAGMSLGDSSAQDGPCSLRSHPRLPASPREWPLCSVQLWVCQRNQASPSMDARKRPPLSPHSCLRPGSGLHAPLSWPRSRPLWSAGTLWHVSQAWGVGGHHWALAWRAEQAGDPTDEATLPTAPLSSAQPLWAQDSSTPPATRNVAGGAQDAHEGLVAPWPHRPSRGPGDSGASFSRTPLGHGVTKGSGPSACPQPPAVRQAQGLRGPSSVLPVSQCQRQGDPQSHGECDPEASGDLPGATSHGWPGARTAHQAQLLEMPPPPGGSRLRTAWAAVPKPKPPTSSAPLSTGMSLGGSLGDPEPSSGCRGGQGPMGKAALESHPEPQPAGLTLGIFWEFLESYAGPVHAQPSLGVRAWVPRVSAPH